MVKTQQVFRADLARDVLEYTDCGDYLPGFVVYRSRVCGYDYVGSVGAYDLYSFPSDNSTFEKRTACGKLKRRIQRAVRSMKVSFFGVVLHRYPAGISTVEVDRTFVDVGYPAVRFFNDDDSGGYVIEGNVAML